MSETSKKTANSANTTTPTNPTNPRVRVRKSNGFIKRHPIYSSILATAGAVGIAAAGYFGHRYLTSDSNTQAPIGYETSIGNTPVSYEEVVPMARQVKVIGDKNIFNYEANRMTIRGQTREYSLIDSLEESSINPEKKQKPGFEKDKLETIVITDKQWGVQIVYNIEQINDQTYTGEHIKKMFEIGNTLYNAVRNQIRNEVIANQSKFHADLENGLSGYTQKQAQQTQQTAGNQLNAQKESIEGCKKALDQQMENYRNKK